MKTIQFNKPRTDGLGANPLDQWVSNADTVPETSESTPIEPVEPVESVTPERMKRLTIDVEPGLHTRIKSQCALRGEKMADLIRQLLEREFPAD